MQKIKGFAMYLLLLFILCFNTVFLIAQNNKSLIVRKIESPIIIDGRVDEVWSYADSATKFIQFSPFHGEEATKKTIAKVLTTDEALFVLLVCYAEQDELQVNTGTFDRYSGDFASIMLDTFNDNKTAYKFTVNASGVQGDSRLIDDARNRDDSWDGIWFAAAEVTDFGYVIEMKIPYKSIQYADNFEYWGLDFDRWIPSLKEDIYWSYYEKNEGQRVSKFGKLIFEEFNPTIRGLNLEVFPVAISKVNFIRDDVYSFKADAGIDILYNPSPQLKLLLTANPDFAQIEADPFNFNISRYESFYSEQRPFFTEGSEIFSASGRQRNSGFYRPLELFYSRRIGKILPDGSEVPLIAGMKAFGRINDWEYGGFLAMTGEKKYSSNGIEMVEEEAYFGSARLSKQIFENSTVGLLFVGKQTKNNIYGVIDIDGAFRASEWQLSYQLARSVNNNDGDYAASFGLNYNSKKWLALAKGRYIGENFDVQQVGYVPWKGTANLTAITGPIWYFDNGSISNILLYLGGVFDYEKIDEYTDKLGVVGFNMQFRDNWGYEINVLYGRSKDSDKLFNSYQTEFSTWIGISSKWNANLWGGYAKTYNFSRNYLAFYNWLGAYFGWRATPIVSLGTNLGLFVEGNPDNDIEDITFNARPFISLTPVNNLNMRLYVDNVFVRSTEKNERMILGFLFSYNFSPKSWIYFAINDVWDRSPQFDSGGIILPQKLHVVNRAAVLKVKYLYYF